MKKIMNYTKKWLFLKYLTKAIDVATEKNDLESISNGQAVVLSEKFFIVGNEPGTDDYWKGLANKYPGKVGAEKKYQYVKFKLSWLLFWQKEYNESKLKKRINNYYKLFKICKEDGYIEMVDGIDGSKRPSTNTLKYDKIRAFPIGYLQGLVQQYDKATEFLIAFISSGIILIIIQLVLKYIFGISL